MSYRTVQSARARGNRDLYITLLNYGQYLWQRDLPARALLALDRALLTILPSDDPIYENSPQPYHAIAWFLTEVDRTLFFGNPRIHYQHLADRVVGRQRTIRSARIWACWHLTRQLRPELEGDPHHLISPPDIASIVQTIDAQGYLAEARILSDLTHSASQSTP